MLSIPGRGGAKKYEFGVIHHFIYRVLLPILLLLLLLTMINTRLREEANWRLPQRGQKPYWPTLRWPFTLRILVTRSKYLPKSTQLPLVVMSSSSFFVGIHWQMGPSSVHQ